MIKREIVKVVFDKIFISKKYKSKFFSNLYAHQEKLCLIEWRGTTFFECDIVYSYRSRIRANRS